MKRLLLYTCILLGLALLLMGMLPDGIDQPARPVVVPSYVQPQPKVDREHRRATVTPVPVDVWYPVDEDPTLDPISATVIASTKDPGER